MVYRVIGLMSGSSLDGLDIVFAELEENRGMWSYAIRAADCYAYSHEWKDRLTGTKNLNAFDYLNYIGEENKNKRNPLVKELNGPGVQGILDKLVCINSNYFLSGPEGCCRVRSSYTRQIVNSRIKLLTEGNRNILNQITRWEN